MQELTTGPDHVKALEILGGPMERMQAQAEQWQTVLMLVTIFGIVTSIAWIVIGWRAMRVLERIAEAIELGAFRRP